MRWLNTLLTGETAEDCSSAQVIYHAIAQGLLSFPWFSFATSTESQIKPSPQCNLWSLVILVRSDRFLFVAECAIRESGRIPSIAWNNLPFTAFFPFALLQHILWPHLIS